jgi:hydrogenase nickel incorporation protein HypA/HybF
MRVHEMGLCAGVVEAVLGRAAGRQVSRVRVRAGALQRVVPDAMVEAFRLVSAGTVAEGAVVDLEVVPVTLTCLACGAVSESEDPYATCARCGGVDVDTSGGDELTLVSVSLRQ